MLQTWCMAQYESKQLELDHKSCEMIARELLNRLIIQFGPRHYAVEVSEDGECGAEIVWDPV